MKKRLVCFLLLLGILWCLSGCIHIKDNSGVKEYLSDKYDMDKNSITILSEEVHRGGGEYTPAWKYTGSTYLCSYPDDDGESREFYVYYTNGSSSDIYCDDYLNPDIEAFISDQLEDYFSASELDKMHIIFGNYRTYSDISSLEELKKSDKSIHVSVVCHDLPSSLWRGFEIEPLSKDFDFCVLCVDDSEYESTAEYYSNRLVFFGPEFGMWNITEYAASWTNNDGKYSGDILNDWYIQNYDSIILNDLIISYIVEDSVVITDLGDDGYHVDADKDTRLDILTQQSNVRVIVTRVEATPVLLGSYNDYSGNYGDYYRLNFPIAYDSDFHLEEY